jgi:hypothetical protein
MNGFKNLITFLNSLNVGDFFTTKDLKMHVTWKSDCSGSTISFYRDSLIEHHYLKKIEKRKYQLLCKIPENINSDLKTFKGS